MSVDKSILLENNPVTPETLSARTRSPLPPEILARCRSVRQNSTDAEKVLWSFLRDRRMKNFKFRRQYPISGYYLDFYCFDVKLAIELDGSGHLEEKQERHDVLREECLQRQGITVLRFWNDEVLNHIEDVLLMIWQVLPEKEE